VHHQRLSPISDPAELEALTGIDAPAAWRAAEAEIRAALETVDLSAPITMPNGEHTGEVLLAMALIEPLVHAWDLAATIGQPVTLDTGRGVEHRRHRPAGRHSAYGRARDIGQGGTRYVVRGTGRARA
jgi:hypothetical protein